jgi:uncharacterized membrane protein YfcA
MDWILVFTAAVFLLAGLVKGVLGLGLPTVAIGLLGLIMTPAQAVVLMFVPTLVTNIWQLAIGPSLVPLLKRLWPMLAGIFVGAWIGGGLLAGGNDWAGSALGAALVAYAILGLTAMRFYVPARAERWLTPVLGVVNGFISAATGVFAIPGVPYMQALNLNKDDLVQALGLLFTASMLALGVVLTHEGAFAVSDAGPPAVALGAALIGMFIGQKVRAFVPAQTFRFCFFLGMLLLGAHLALRAWL